MIQIRWTARAITDLARLYDHLEPVAPEAAARILARLSRAPDRLLDFPRIGERLDAYAPREVRRIKVDDYAPRYEIRGEVIAILRIWHGREHRPISG